MPAGRTEKRALLYFPNEYVLPIKSTQQPWKGLADHPLLANLQQLNALYDEGTYKLPVDTELSLGSVWRNSLNDDDREKAFAAAEVGTLLNLRRALRNGTKANSLCSFKCNVVGRFK